MSKSVNSDKRPFTDSELDFISQVHGYGKYSKYFVNNHATFKEHEDIAKLEKLYLPNELVATPEVTWGWQSHNNEILFVVRKREDSSLVGHLSAFPISLSLAECLCSHTTHDTEFRAENIQLYTPSQESVLYVAVVCVAEEHRGLPTDLLFKELKKLLVRKIDMGCIFTKVIAEACTANGENVLTKLGFTKLDKKLPAMFECPTDLFLSNIEAWLHSRAKSRAYMLRQGSI